MGMTLFAFIILLFAMILLSIINSIRKKEQLRRYQNINTGMSEAEMLSIMGNGYNKSLLENNRTKYEWRINATSKGYSYRGFSSRSYSGVHKVTIMVKDGVVEEVRPYNVD